MEVENKSNKLFALASLDQLKSCEYCKFINNLYDLAVTCGLDTRFNPFKAWEYAWFWHSRFKDVNWSGKRVVCIRSESSPLPWFLATHGAKVTLVDIEARWLNIWIQARNILGVDVDWFIEGSEKIPFEDEVIDVVVSSSALVRQLSREVAIEEAVRILKRGGLLAVSAALCETELGMSFNEYNGKWNGRALRIKEFEKLIWQHPSFDQTEHELQWNFDDCRELISWTKQIEQINYTLGAAILSKVRSGGRKAQETKNLKPIFLHIPKTAGETFNRMLESTFTDQSLFKLNPFDTTRSFRDLRAVEFEKPDQIHVIAGHAGFGFSRNLPNEYVYFTLLRNPVDRVLSYLDFIYCTPDHPLHQTLRNNPEIDFASGPFVSELCNLQTRMIAGYYDFITTANMELSEARLKAAKRNLDSFVVVGLTEEFDAFVMMVNWKFGWQLAKIARQNITRELLYRKNTSPQLIEMIKYHNQLDIELYEYAQKLFNNQLAEMERSIT